jgi:hypothetical protein
VDGFDVHKGNQHAWQDVLQLEVRLGRQLHPPHRKRGGFHQRRGGAFFAFVRSWVAYVESTALNFQSLEWRYFPGYSLILHAFLAELHLRHVESASEGLRQAASALLANEKLLSPLVVILLKKTNAMNQTSVAKTMEFVHHLFSSISSRCECLPAAFDVKYFLKGLKVVLEGESSYAIGMLCVM